MLRCPVCKSEIQKKEKQYVCVNNHSFDIAKQGYTNVYLKSSQHSGDNKQMVESRTSFLNMQYYQPLCDAIIALIQELGCSTMVDAGCGEGYYTNQMKQYIDTIYAFDLSKDALKYAARQNPNVHYFLSSIFDLPIADASVDLITNVFAPCADEEFHRILKNEGYLIKVDPNVMHLHEMKEVLYDDVQDNEVLAIQVDGFTLVTHKEVSFMMDLDQKGIEALYKMTPYSYKSKKERSEVLLQLPKLSCVASFIIYVFKKGND